MTGPHPDSPERALRHADVLTAQGRLDEALAVVDAALAANADDVTLLLRRARLMLTLGRPRPAVDTLRSAIALRPDAAAPLQLMAHAESVLGEHRAAEQTILRAIEIAPDSADQHLQYARILLEIDSLEGRALRQARALKHANVAVSLAPEEPIILRDAALISLDLGLSSDARSLLTRALSLAPQDETLLTLQAEMAAPGQHDATRLTPAALIAGAESRLRQSPADVWGRSKLLYGILWQTLPLLDTPLICFAIVSLAIALTFQHGGAATTLIVGLCVATVVTGIRMLRSRLTLRQANAGFRSRAAQSSPYAQIRTGLSATGWIIGGSCALALLLVREAVTVRWMIVGIGVASLLSLASSVMGQAGVVPTVERIVGRHEPLAIVGTLVGWRGRLRASIALRVGLAVLLTLCIPLAGAGRDDALAVLLMCLGGLILSPAIGVLLARRGEESAIVEIEDPASAPGWASSRRRPGLVLCALIALVAAATTAAGALMLPVFPGRHDTEGAYELAWPVIRGFPVEHQDQPAPIPTFPDTPATPRTVHMPTVPSFPIPKITGG